MSSANAPKFNIAICGGGIGGLCLAVALSHYPDIKVDVYEATERFKEIGAGVMFWDRTWKILAKLGLTNDMKKVTHVATTGDGSEGIGFDFRRSDSPREGFQYHLFSIPNGCFRFHRAHFLDVFVDHLPPNIAHFGKRLKSYNDHPKSASVGLQFEDGSTALCDLLVGCDGIKSTVRKQMYETKIAEGQPHLSAFVDPVWSGAFIYRSLVPAEQLRKKNSSNRALEIPTIYSGKSRHLISYPVASGSIVNVVGIKTNWEKEDTVYKGPWVTACSAEEFRENYSGWEPEVTELLSCVGETSKWAIHALRPLPFWVSGRVALLGDAAHAMTTHQGAGAGQAIEDAFVLASLLGRTCVTRENIPKVLQAYEAVRLPLVNEVLRGSKFAGRMYEFDSFYGDDYASLASAIKHQWDWLFTSPPEEAIQTALKMIHDVQHMARL
ncbi:FAD/NAD(P)-binding domain-containing protein [Abortiporus biennis]|nr:FAD/NAD(P)-binding domain-containing protein [Abortiporus biennis]